MLALFAFATQFVSAQSIRIAESRADGSISWANTQPGGYYGVETSTDFKIWKPIDASGLYNVQISSPVATIKIPRFLTTETPLFFRVVWSKSPMREYFDPENGVPRFVGHDYIDLSKIASVSRFRSDFGHDYSDDFEQCRSMKHYFAPKWDAPWGNVEIYSPISGTIESLYEEWAGTQIRIRSSEHPAFLFILFHVKRPSSMDEGDSVTKGQRLGTHVGNQTASDIAVLARTLAGRRYLSFFDVMEEPLFEKYLARGARSRSDFIIAAAQRDLDPIHCDGGAFITQGEQSAWVHLDP